MHFDLNFLPPNLIHNKPTLVQVMAWHQTGDKSLPKIELTQLSPDLNELTKAVQVE